MGKRKLLLTVMCLIGITAGFVGLTACKKSGPTQPAHKYSTEWSSNSENHYHACTDSGCTSVTDSEGHSFGEWKVVTPATVEAKGREKRECTVCKREEYRDTDKLTSAEHKHKWSEWTVTEANKPDETTEGKATRTCTGSGECTATVTDTEYTLPALTSAGLPNADYSKSEDTATCSSEGSVTYTYNKNDVSVSFDIATPVKADAHKYGNYTSKDDTGHYKICAYNSDHKTESEKHDFEGAGGACSVCGYEWQNMLTPTTRSVTITVGGDSPKCKVYGYPLAPAYYTYGYDGEKPITISYRYYRLGDKAETTGTVTLSHDGQRSFYVYLETKATCTMEISSDEETAFQATLSLISYGQTDPNRTETFTLNTPTDVVTTHDGVKYQFTAATEDWYVLTCYNKDARIKVLSGDDADEVKTSPYQFHLGAGEKILFLMCSDDADLTYSAKITVLTPEQCAHDYTSEDIPATCTVKAHKNYTCKICGDEYADNYTGELKAHGYVWETTSEPNCTDEGEKEGTCSACGKIVHETIAANGHDTEGVEWETVKAATCSKEGQKKLVCKVCGEIAETEVIDIDPAAHSYGAYIKTDSEGHYKVCAYNSTHTTQKAAHDMNGNGGACSVCGYVWTNMIKPTAPQYTFTVGNGTSATVYGYAPSAAYYTYTYKGEKPINVAYSYSAGETQTTGTVTLSHDGRRSLSVYLGVKGVCTMTVTSDEETAFQATLQLTYYGQTDPNRTETFTLNTTATVNTTYDGVKYEFTAATEDWYVLTRNGENARVLLEGDTEALTLPYQFHLGAGEKVTFLMCSEDDDATYRAKVAVLTPSQCAHEYTSEDIPATCTVKAHKLYTCGICGDEYSDNYTGELKPHGYEWETTTEPSCTEEGEKVGTCSVCGKIVHETIAATGHDTEDVEWVTVTAATCSAEGQKKLVCKVCGETAETEVIDIDPSAHSYGAYIKTDSEGHYKVCAYNNTHTTQKAAHDMNGNGGACSVCGYVWTNMIKPTAPQYTFTVGNGTSATVYGYAPSAAYYTYTYKGEKPINVAYSYLAGGAETTGTVTLSRDGRRSLSVYLGVKGVCTMVVTSDETTAFEATIELTYYGQTDPNRTETFTLNTTATVNTTYDGVKYEFTAATEGWYVLTRNGENARVLPEGGAEALTLPYEFHLDAGEKITFLMCSVDEDATYSAKVAKITPENCTHNYTEEVVAPTCSAQGYTLHECDKCGDSYKDVYTSMLPHSYQYNVTKEPSCTDIGKRTGVCSECGDTVEEEMDILPHSTVTAVWHTVKEANCTEEGSEELRCTVCNNVVNTRAVPVNVNAHSYVLTAVELPTIEDEGVAQLVCNHNEEHKQPTTVILPNLTSKLYTKTENGEFITYTIETDLGELTFSVETEEITTISKAIEYAVSTSGMIVDSTVNLSIDAPNGGNGTIIYEFGDNYVHATDGYMKTERWITLKEDGTFFALIEKEDRYAEIHVMNDTGACMDDFKGYGFRFIYAQQEWDMLETYGAAQFIDVLYKFASQNPNSKNFTQEIQTKNGKTYYTFSYRFVDPDPNNNTDMNHAISVEFTLNGDYFIDYCKIVGQSYRGKTIGSGTLLGTQTYTVTQYSRRGVGAQVPVNPYNEDTIALTDYKLQYVASVDDALENIVLGTGYFPINGENNSLGTISYGKTYIMQVVDYAPAEGVNFRYDVINFYLRAKGASGLGELLNGSYEDGEEGHVLASYDPISRLVSLGFYRAGEYELIFKTVKTEKVVSFNIPVQTPDKIEAYVYVEDVVSGENAWKSDISEFEIVTGYSLSFYGRVPHPGYQYSEYTVAVKKDGVAVSGVLTETDGIYEFTPNAVGSYTITLTTTHGNCTKTFSVQVLNAPDPDYLDGKFANDYKGVSIQFNASQSRFTLNVGGTTSVYSYALNGTAVTKSLVSGTYSEFGLYFNNKSELIFEKDGEKVVLFKEGETNAIIGNWSLVQEAGSSVYTVLLKVNVTDNYTFTLSSYTTYLDRDSNVRGVTSYAVDGGNYSDIKEVFNLNLKSGQIIEFSSTISITLTVAKTIPVTGVELNESSKELFIGEAFSLIATVNPSDANNKMTVWTSSDTEVATVTVSGYVVAVGEGTAIITVTTADGGKTATCTVTVSPKAVTGVTISGETHTIYMNETLKLTATVAPDDATYKNVTWTSSDMLVATVDQNGLVTPVGAGNAIITVTTADGGKTDSWTVTVKNEKLQSVSLSPSTQSLKVNEQLQLTATLNPANATYTSKEFTSSNSAVASVDQNGKVTAKAAGTATITFTVTAEGETFTATCEIEVTVVAVTGITLSASEKNVNKGDSFTLTATVTPDDATYKNVTWESSNSNIASVDQNGKVTAVGNGAATITCTVDGTAFSASCSVNVTSLRYGVGTHEFSYATSTSTTFELDGEVGVAYNLTIYQTSASARYNNAAYMYNYFYVNGVKQGLSYGPSCNMVLESSNTEITIERSLSSTATTSLKLVITKAVVSVGGELELGLVSTTGMAVKLSGCVLGKEYKVTASGNGCDNLNIQIKALNSADENLYSYGEATFIYKTGMELFLKSTIAASSTTSGTLTDITITLEEIVYEAVEHTSDHELSYTFKDANKHTVSCSVGGCNYEMHDENHAFDDDSDAYCEYCGNYRVVHNDSHTLVYSSKNDSKHTVSCYVADCIFEEYEEEHDFVNGSCSKCFCNQVIYAGALSVGGQMTVASLTWSAETIQLSGCEVGKEYKATALVGGTMCSDVTFAIPALGIWGYFGNYGEITFTYADGVSIQISSNGNTLTNVTLTLEEVVHEVVVHTSEHVLSYTPNGADKHMVSCSVAYCNYEAHVEDHVYDDDDDDTCNDCGYKRMLGGETGGYTLTAPGRGQATTVTIDSLDTNGVTIALSGLEQGVSYSIGWYNESTWMWNESITVVMAGQGESNFIMFEYDGVTGSVLVKSNSGTLSNVVIKLTDNRW